MVSEDPQLGCFGLPSAISFNCATCRSCSRSSGCVSVSAAFLESLPDTPEIARERLSFAVTARAFASAPAGAGEGRASPALVASTRGLKRLQLTDTQEDMLKTLPTKVAAQLRTLMERGWLDFAKVELRHGRNPAGKGWRKVFCDFLLAGGGARASLELALVERLEMSPSSARVQVSVGMAIFASGRLATEVFGKIQLLPN